MSQRMLPSRCPSTRSAQGESEKVLFGKIVGFCYRIKEFTNPTSWNAWEIFSIPPLGEEIRQLVKRLERDLFDM